MPKLQSGRAGEQDHPRRKRLDALLEIAVGFALGWLSICLLNWLRAFLKTRGVAPRARALRRHMHRVIILGCAVKLGRTWESNPRVHARSSISVDLILQIDSIGFMNADLHTNCTINCCHDSFSIPSVSNHFGKRNLVS